ncbi:hypothetical protein P168DRAFT_183709 [Aspergillus campestris IBT 28561]|uniref:Cytochrome P450 n=1 Tax=Aspergillus campestris (strain IBT 28561) TaxID=1392248 RepID=A0A2I1CXT2_ASPC2|nr:uncharacterized protein P168DRAFT_183709 [Aspergillus campestris IBT 28561]PKY02423.1 hypothetical protein P168DRAFT_183709 [Aspergillus campestris IBT 28561]
MYAGDLGTYEVMRDLLDTRGTIYNSRPNFFVLDQCMTMGLKSGFQRYGPAWEHLHRRVTAAFFKPKGVDAYQAVQDLETKELIFNLCSPMLH